MKDQLKEWSGYRLGEKNLNNQGCLMKIVEYNNFHNITVEFQDKYKAKVITTYNNFVNKQIKNPYHPSVCGIGIVGDKYPTKINRIHTKEYQTWRDMLKRCFDEKTKEGRPTYKNVGCCEEWLLYDNFYEWLHNQENFNKWYVGDRWHLDKDILIKGNKIYSPNTCTLVPNSVNQLFTKRDNNRGDLPIGVIRRKNKFTAQCTTMNGHKHLGYYDTSEDAFYLGYKPYKEIIIKQTAQEEYAKGNITKVCFDAMMNYEVEITD